MLNDVYANTTTITTARTITTQVHKALKEKLHTDLVDDTQIRTYSTTVAVKDNPLRQSQVNQPQHVLSITLISRPKGYTTEPNCDYDFTVIIPINLADQREPEELISLQPLLLKDSCYVIDLTYYSTNPAVNDDGAYEWLRVPVTTTHTSQETDFSFNDVADIIVNIAIACESA